MDPDSILRLHLFLSILSQTTTSVTLHFGLPLLPHADGKASPVSDLFSREGGLGKQTNKQT